MQIWTTCAPFWRGRCRRDMRSRAVWIARAMGKPHRVAGALGNLANVALTAGDFPAARALHLESLAIWREVNDRFGEAVTLHNLGYLAYKEKQLTEARAYYEQSLEMKRE